MHAFLQNAVSFALLLWFCMNQYPSFIYIKNKTTKKTKPYVFLIVGLRFLQDMRIEKPNYFNLSCTGSYIVFIQQLFKYYTRTFSIETSEPQREKVYLLPCAPNKDSNQPADPGRLIRVFVVHMKKVCIFGYS